MRLDDNKIILLGRINNLKDEFITEIARIIEQKSENRYYETTAKLNNVKDRFADIMKSEGISVNEEYLTTQLDVLLAEMKRDIGKSDEELYTWIITRLNRYLDIMQTETDETEIEMQTRR